MPNNEFGDFQTPKPLADALVKTLPQQQWARVLEPTCGVGNFMAAILDVFPDADTVGVEVQPEYVVQASQVSRVIEADIFGFDLAKDISWKAPSGPTLVVGNPPWVTNSQLSSLGSSNRPERSNFKNAKGIDAITGSSNFDIAEYIWIKLLTEFSGQPTTIALICKTQVARNVLLHCSKLQLPVTSSSLRLIDAKKWFGAAVDACWFILNLGPETPNYSSEIYADLDAVKSSSRLGVVNGQLVADVGAYERSKQFDGASPATWRQGVKHDATAAMELVEKSGPKTKLGLPVDIESTHLYPLFKCTDVYRNKLQTVARWMVVPQRHTGDDTKILEQLAPKLWAYLNDNAELLDGRKSSIYKNRARFCIFGVGEYTFSPYKVAISGFHKVPEFRMVGPYAGQPAVFDDATYLLPFTDPLKCAVAYALLTGPEAKDLIASLAFWDSKRPVTKKLLQRIDLLAIAESTDRQMITDRALMELHRQQIDVSSAEVEKALDGLISDWRPDITPIPFLLTEQAKEMLC